MYFRLILRFAKQIKMYLSCFQGGEKEIKRVWGTHSFMQRMNNAFLKT